MDSEAEALASAAEGRSFGYFPVFAMLSLLSSRESGPFCISGLPLKGGLEDRQTGMLKVGLETWTGRRRGGTFGLSCCVESGASTRGGPGGRGEVRGVLVRSSILDSRLELSIRLRAADIALDCKSRWIISVARE